MTRPSRRHTGESPEITEMRMKKVLIVTISATLLGLVTRAADTTDTNTNTATATASTMPAGSYNSYSSHAGKFGAGVTFGEPIGADVKYWFNETMAVDGALGWSFHDDTDVYLHSDVLWHNFHLIPVSQGQMPALFRRRRPGQIPAWRRCQSSRHPRARGNLVHVRQRSRGHLCGSCARH